jgi:hypothetical protein
MTQSGRTSSVVHVVTVAALGPVFGYPEVVVFEGASLRDQGPERPYSERLKTSVDASLDTRLGEIIDAAATAFDIRWAGGGPISEYLRGVVFYEPTDEYGFQHRPQPWPSAIRTVGANGAPSWSVRWRDVRFGELLASADAGLVRGDPFRPYLWPVIPQGEAGPAFLEALWSSWIIWEHLLAAYGTVQLARTILERIRRARGSVFDQDSGARWQDALARPQDVIGYLTERPRDSHDVAAYVDRPVSETENALLGVGYVRGADGRWRAGADDAGQALHRIVIEIERAGGTPAGTTLRIVLEQLLGSESPGCES